MHIRERLTDGSFRESTIRKTYEDAYTLEMKELYAVVVDGKPVKTTAADARKDLEVAFLLFSSIFYLDQSTVPGVDVLKAW